MFAEFSMTRRVCFSETDLAQVMHFSNYFRWMEDVEHAWMRSLGMSVIQAQGGETISWPRVHVSCEYFAPARFQDEFELKLQVTDLSNTSMTYEVVFERGGRKVARGRAKAVCCRMREGGVFEPTPIPPEIRSKLEGK